MVYRKFFILWKIFFLTFLCALLFKLNPEIFPQTNETLYLIAVFTDPSINVQLELKLKVNCSIVPLLCRNYILSLSFSCVARKNNNNNNNSNGGNNFRKSRQLPRNASRVHSNPRRGVQRPDRQEAASRSRLSHEIEGSSFTGHSHSLTPVDVSIKFSPVRVGNLN